MKKLLLFFAVLFTCTLVTSKLKAQTGYEVVELNIGNAYIGKEFCVPILNSYDRLGGYAAYFQHINSGCFKIVSIVQSPSSSPQVLGEICMNNSNPNISPKQRVYRIIGIVTGTRAAE